MQGNKRQVNDSAAAYLSSLVKSHILLPIT